MLLDFVRFARNTGICTGRDACLACPLDDEGTVSTKFVYVDTAYCHQSYLRIPFDRCICTGPYFRRGNQARHLNTLRESD